MTTSTIAIVGMACEYPDASSPLELFENTLTGRRAFRRIPDQRLPISDYVSDDPDAVDSTTVREAALIEGWSFDRMRFRTVGSTFRQTDLVHWLALDVADRALADAGFPNAEGLPRERAGVILGNTLTGEFTRAQALRLRWPYVSRVLAETLAAHVPDEASRAVILAEAESRYKEPFEPFGDESLAGGLANTIAGRICNHFDLKGGGFTIDGACSSSLLAVANACGALVSGDLEVAIVGGVDLSLDPFELVGFARAGALAKHEMRVYDRRAQGFWPGEGCGILVLMPEDAARAQGRRIYARVCGWGMSSDGAGGISRPEVEGQMHALRRAYARAGFGPETVGYFEGHGTGTEVGDETELNALTRILAETGVACDAATPIGSVKANIGHTKAAAGAAGLIRAVFAAVQGIVPPLPGCDRPHERVDPNCGARLRTLRSPEPWPLDRPRRAGVSSMGFGGINLHVVVEATRGGEEPGAISARCTALAHAPQDAELFLLAAPDDDTLRDRLVTLAARASGISLAELGDLAAFLARNLPDASTRAIRAAVVASKPSELASGLARIADWLGDAGRTPGEARLDTANRCFVAGPVPGRIGFLFPGQAAPVRGDLGELSRWFGRLGLESPLERHRQATRDLATSDPDTPVDTALAQPAIVSASLAALRLLERLGVIAHAAVGHSVGEIAGLAWSGALCDDDAVILAARRGQLMSQLALSGGGMASIAATPARTELLVKQEPCCVAAVNGPERCVVAGPLDAVHGCVERARSQGIGATLLPVSHAFHSPAMEPCSSAFAEIAAATEFREPGGTLVSTVTGGPLAPDCDLAAHLVRQLTEPVRFADALSELASSVDLLVEVGPGLMLATLANEYAPVPAIAIDGTHEGSRDLLSAAGAAFVLGAPLCVDALFEQRATKPFDPEQPARLFENPCGRGGGRPSDAERAPEEAAAQTTSDLDDGSAIAVVTALAAARCELPAAALSPDDRFLSDLHLTSIAVSELAAKAARALGRPPLVAPNEFADAKLSELAAAIDSDERVPTTRAAAGVDAWVRAFEVAWHERPLARAASRTSLPRGGWQAFAPEGSRLVTPLADALENEVGGEGVLVYVPPSAGEAGVELVLAAARASIAGLGARHFVLIHHGDATASIARTLHQESSSLSTRVIELTPCELPDAERIVAEVRSASAYTEVRYDGSRRLERFLRVLPPQSDCDLQLPLDSGDVLLVTGGGKGIAAECAYALAKRVGCALGIVGRSDPQSDDALRAGLARLDAAGVRYAYARADVGDAAQTRRAIESLQSELGPVSGLLHGAGVNEPCALATLELAQLQATVAPKVGGLVTLLACLDALRLRCVVAFGSLIAEIGLPGEAHYAYANDAMTRTLERYADEHPSVRCQSIEWSIWSGVGMGDRLGRVEILASQNITAISPDTGCFWLEHLLSRADVPVRTVVTGRFGSPATLRSDAHLLPIERFLERTREYTPGVELVAEAQLDHESDPWLADHVYDGEPIVPGVVGLEAMAQVARALDSTSALPRFENVRFILPISVQAGEKCLVRIAALVRRPGEIDLVIRAGTTGFAADHMSATARFDLGDVAPGESHSDRPCATRIPAGPLYGDVFFHSGRFRRVSEYSALHWDGCNALLRAGDARLFGGFQPQALALGDACARDAAVHAIQACLPEVDVLPTGVEQIDILEPLGPGPLWLEARERSRDERSYVYDLSLFASEGRLVERWRGLLLERVAAQAGRSDWPPGLLAPRLEELAREAMPMLDLRAGCVPGVTREASARAVSLALGHDTTLRYRGDGRPEQEDGFVSASHAAGHTLAFAASRPVGCDFEVVLQRDAATWCDLLGSDGLAAARLLAANQKEPLERAATRVWGAREALRKLGAPRDLALVVTAGAPDAAGVARLTAGRFAVLSFAARLSDATPVVTTLVGSGDAKL